METAHKMIEVNAFGTFIRNYYLFKREHLSANIKLTLYKALIRSVMTHVRSALEPMKITTPEKQGSPAIRNFPRCIPVCDLHTTFNLLYIRDYIVGAYHNVSRG
jgi:hypothetical protein